MVKLTYIIQGDKMHNYALCLLEQFKVWLTIDLVKPVDTGCVSFAAILFSIVWLSHRLNYLT